MARGSFTPDSDAGSSDNVAEKSRKPDNTAFKQQRLPAWQPILTAHSVLPAFFCLAVVFVPIGVVLLLASNDVVEYKSDYTQCGGGECARLREDPELMTQSCVCNITINVDKEMKNEVYVYYGLSNYFQNHRRYVKSRDDEQLYGDDKSNDINDDCKPFARENGTNKVIAPCGAIANSLFNDTFTLTRVGGETITLNRTGITWKTDKQQKFNNPDPKDNLTEAFAPYGQPKFWQKRVEQLDPGNIENNGYENEALIVWMRTAAFPKFRKLYARIPDGLPAGNYSISIDYNYPVTSFDGKKRIILSTTSWIGGKNDFLGIAYLVVGSLCFAVGVALCIVHQLTKKSSVSLGEN